MNNKNQLQLIYKIHTKWLESQTKFIKLLKIKRNQNLIASYYNNQGNNDYFITFLVTNQKFKNRFISIHRLFLKLILIMKSAMIIKTVNKVNIDKYRLLLRKKKRDYNNIKELLEEFLNIKKKIKYFVSNSYIHNSLFFNISNVRYKYYYKNQIDVKKFKCEESHCNDRTSEERNKIYDDFINEKKKIKSNGDNRAIKINNFINSDAFKRFYECFYNNCNRSFLSFLRSKANYYFANESLKTPIIGRKYKKDFNDLIKSLMYSKIKNFKDFLFAIGKYWKFVIKLNIYI